MGVVVVSGFPAAGKSTLTRRLAADLGFVVVCRDRLITDSGLRDVQLHLPMDKQTMIPAATDKIVTHMMDAILQAGRGVVVDNNFNWKEQRDPVRRFVVSRQLKAVEVCLWGDPEVLRQRFADRANPPMDDHLTRVFMLAVSRPREPVLGPPTPTFEFDTTELSLLEDAYPGLLQSVTAALD